MKKVSCILFIAILLFAPLVSAEEHGLFSAVLKDYVTDGQVEYPALCRDPRLGQYLGQLANTSADRLENDAARLAFWINVYNAYTLKLICDHYPVKSINELHRGGLIFGTLIGKTAWDREIVQVKGATLSLGQVEHKILRPVFKDPRIHFAIVCAAKGCPPLRSQAYEAKALNEQLNDQARKFLSTPLKNTFDPAKKIATISPIFSWFKEDFGSRLPEVLEFIAQFLDPTLAVAIKSDAAAWKIRYSRYDWNLNSKSFVGN